MKNNKPKAVIVSLQKYEEMRNDIKRLATWIEEMEDNKLYVEAKERIRKCKDEDLVSMEEVVKEESLDMKEIEKLADNLKQNKEAKRLNEKYGKDIFEALFD